MLRFRDGRIGRPQCESIDAPEAARCVVHSARRAGTVSIEQSDPVNWMNMEQIDHEPMRASAGRMTKKRRGISIRTDGGRIVGIRRAHGRGLAQCKVDRGEGCAVSKTATVMEWQTQQEHTVARTQTHSRTCVTLETDGTRLMRRCRRHHCTIPVHSARAAGPA